MGDTRGSVTLLGVHKPVWGSLLACQDQQSPAGSWSKTEPFFQDIFPISLKLLRNMYAALWEILRTQKICVLLLRSVLTSLASGTVAVSDNKIPNICVYSSVNM